MKCEKCKEQVFEFGIIYNAGIPHHKECGGRIVEEITKYTAYEIWKIINNTHPQKLMGNYGFDSTSEFELLAMKNE